MPRSTHSEAYERLRDALVAARDRAGVTQVALAERLGKPQSFVSKFENRERRLDLIEVLAVLRALGIDEVRFLTDLVRDLPAELRI